MAHDNIIFLGRLYGGKKQKYLSECKAMIFPGIEDYGITPLEAMASGRPVLSVNEGGVKEYLQNNINGITFDYNSSTSLNECIEKFEENILIFDANKIRNSIKEYNNHNFRDKLKRAIDSITRENV